MSTPRNNVGSNPGSRPGTVAAPPAKPRPPLGVRVARAFLVLIVVLALLAAAYTWFTLAWSYSEGERAGVLQKFSKKGWICKTYEGELALYIVGGVAPQLWNFTVRDAVLAEKLHSQVGRSLRLRYTEHVGVPTSCFGDTRYFVEAFEVVDTPLPNVIVPGQSVTTVPAVPLAPATPPAAVPANPPLALPAAPAGVPPAAPPASTSTTGPAAG